MLAQDFEQLRILPARPYCVMLAPDCSGYQLSCLQNFTKFLPGLISRIPSLSSLGKQGKAGNNKYKISVCPRLVIYIVRRNLKQLLYLISFSYWMRSITWRNPDQRVQSETFLILSPIPNAEAILMFILMLFIKNLLNH